MATVTATVAAKATTTERATLFAFETHKFSEPIDM
jgi:hypothetical protein